MLEYSATAVVFIVPGIFSAPLSGFLMDHYSLVKGMRQIEAKNIVTDLQSKKKKWEDLNIPEELIHALEDLKMNKPSIIQAASIPKILENRN